MAWNCHAPKWLKQDNRPSPWESKHGWASLEFRLAFNTPYLGLEISLQQNLTSVFLIVISPSMYLETRFSFLGDHEAPRTYHSLSWSSDRPILHSCRPCLRATISLHFCQHLLLSAFWNSSHSWRCEVVAHCGFDVHFPTERMVSSIFSQKCLLKPFVWKNRFVCLFVVEVKEFFIYSEY